jgi:hypothetical protein
MKSRIIRKIEAALLSIPVIILYEIVILMVIPVFPTGSILVASAASAPPTVTISNIPDYVNALSTISGTTIDATPRTISKVQVQIINQSNNTYWDGSAWQAQVNIQTVDIGGVGHYSSLAFDGNGNPAISYLDNSKRDLKFARWNGSSWVLQIVDSDGEPWYYTTQVGSYSSLAFDGSGNPAISYCDYTDFFLNVLKLARWNGSSWVLQTVDSAGDVGYDTSLAFDGNGNPAISYRDNTNDSLKLARWNGSSWVLQTVDSSGMVGRGTSLAFDGSGNPAISYCDYPDLFSLVTVLKLARWNGSSWVLQTVDSAGNSGSLSFDGSGNPAISYRSTNDALKLARWNGSSWVLQTVDSAGGFGSLSFDGSGNPAISYYQGGLKLARWNGSSWVLQTVDSVGSSSSSLAFDGSGNPAISYFNSTNSSLKFARWNTSWNDVPGSTASWSYTLPTLTNVSSYGSSYTIFSRIIDSNGNLLATTSKYFTYDSATPAISSVSVSNNISATSVTINWTTNEASTSQIEYGTSTSYGSVSALDSKSVTSHSVKITGLTPGTVYHYRVKSKDTLINEGVSADGTFTTPPPAISGDINSDGYVTVLDAILVLQVSASLHPSDVRPDYVESGADVNGDNKIGLAEVIYILQTVSEIR